MKHRITVVGDIGQELCYLDIGRDVALQRYSTSGLQQANDSPPKVFEFEFDDVFGAYDVYSVDDA